MTSFGDIQFASDDSDDEDYIDTGSDEEVESVKTGKTKKVTVDKIRERKMRNVLADMTLSSFVDLEHTVRFIWWCSFVIYLDLFIWWDILFQLEDLIDHDQVAPSSDDILLEFMTPQPTPPSAPPTVNELFEYLDRTVCL